MEKRILITLIILLVLYFNFPKTALTVGENEIISCSCMGFPIATGETSKKCIGLTFDCIKQLPPNEKTSLKNLKEICQKKSCSGFVEYLGVPKEKEKGIKKIKRINMMIIIDTSFSMLGEKIDNTISASEEMINSLKAEDRVGIIEFNSLSRVAHELSVDKADVIRELGNLTPKEYTRYVPALKLANERFKAINDNEANNIIIFLSDGIPLDNVSDIIEITNELDQAGVGIYTIRIGDLNQTALDSNHIEGDILKKMTNIHEGGGFFLTKKADTVSSTFDSIYHDIIKDTDKFKIKKNIKDDMKYPEEFSLPIALQIFSSENMRVVPGYLISDSGVLCVDDAKINLVIKDTDNKIVENVSMDYIGGEYISEITGLWPGNYTIDAEIRVEFENSSDCSFFDEQKLASLTITPKGNGSCRTLSCEEIKEMIKDPSKGGAEFSVDTKRLLFALDSSASMKDEGKLKYASSAVNSMVQRLPQGFSIGMISFNEEARLIQRFTQSKKAILDALDNIGVGGTTNYLPALEEADGLLGNPDFDPGKELPNDFLVILSDGIPWDKGMPDSIMKKAEKIVDKGVCIFTIGYGSDISMNPDAEDILREIAKVSKQNLDCGEYFYSDPNEDELDEIFSYIFSDITENGDIFIKPSINSQIFEPDDKMTLFSKIYSSYNGLELPKIDEGSCQIDAYVSLTAMDSKNNSLQEMEMAYAPDIGYHLINEHIPLGTRILRLDSWVEEENGTLCSINGTRAIPVKVINGKDKTYKFYLSLSSVLINSFMVMVLVFSLILLLKRKKTESQG